MKNRFFVLISMGVFCACNNGTAKEETTAQTVAVDSNTVTQPSPDTLSGAVYSGVMPCIDCDSIQTMVSLKADSTFEKRITYLGLNDSTVAMAPQKGRWSMIEDTVQLLHTTAPNRFIRRDSLLLQLDLMGLPMLDKQGDTLGLKRIK
jgi:hypothetical protein